jgi:predicted nucleotidyltransferase
MRLSDHDRQFIREAAADIFGPGTRVRLFGSRLDDQARGGDVDLLVVSDHVLADRQARSLSLVARIQKSLWDRPVDVLVVDPATPIGPVQQRALAEGEAL